MDEQVWNLLNEDDQNLLLLLRLKEGVELKYVMRNAIEAYLGDQRRSEWFEAWVKDSINLYKQSGLDETWFSAITKGSDTK